MNIEKKNVILTPDEENNLNTRSKCKVNRLKRSPKLTQTHLKVQPKHKNFTVQTADFKTPTRVPQARFRTPLTDESPNNDSEFQHEIIWDSTSPVTPNRPGRGSRRACFRSIDVSDLVNRIAPQERRPEEAETSLLQWIGDTAIPCTPEVSELKPRSKSTRQITVDNLLKLAKQFDFNMIHQESACIQPNSFSVEEDPDLSFNKDDSPASLHNDSKAVKASDCTEEVKTKNDDSMVFDLGMEDDLDLLFDTSTQQVSNNLSLSLNKCSQEVAKIDFDVDENLDAYTKLRNSFAAQLDRASESTSIKENIAIHNDTNFQKMHSTDDFDDDWSNDDLLEDSLVMEMTQNPELFSTTRKSSTQKLTRMNGNEKHSLYRNMNSFPHGRNQNLDAIDLKCSTTRGHNRSSRSFHQKNISAGTICNAQGFPSKNNWERQACPSNKFQSAASGSLSLKPYQPNVLTNTYQPTKSLEMLRPARAARTGFAHFLTKRSVVCSNPVQSSLVYNKNLADDKENNPMTDNCDITVEDLDFIFATDDIWVDGADDDDLFCEACEKVEEFMNEPEPPKTIFAKSTLQNLENRITVSSNSRNTSINLSKPDQNWVFVPPQNQTSSITNNVHSGGITHNYENPSVENTVNNSLMKISSSFSEGCYKFNHIKSKPGLSSAAYKSKMQQPVCQIGTLTSQQSAPNILVDHQFNKPYSTLKAKPTNSQGFGKCSDAEIEMKKQQAIERRRLRMLASQNFGAST